MTNWWVVSLCKSSDLKAYNYILPEANPEPRFDLIRNLRSNIHPLNLTAVGTVQILESELTCLWIKVDLSVLPGNPLLHRECRQRPSNDERIGYHVNALPH